MKTSLKTNETLLSSINISPFKNLLKTTYIKCLLRISQKTFLSKKYIIVLLFNCLSNVRLFIHRSSFLTLINRRLPRGLFCPECSSNIFKTQIFSKAYHTQKVSQISPTDQRPLKKLLWTNGSSSVYHTQNVSQRMYLIFDRIFQNSL